MCVCARARARACVYVGAYIFNMFVCVYVYLVVQYNYIPRHLHKRIYESTRMYVSMYVGLEICL